jgi:hypothetical protein
MMRAKLVLRCWGGAALPGLLAIAAAACGARELSLGGNSQPAARSGSSTGDGSGSAIASAGNAGAPAPDSSTSEGGTSGQSGGSQDSGLPDAGIVASCGVGSGLGPTVALGYRRLSKREYNNVVRDLLGDTTEPANQFPQEVYANGYDNGSAALTLDSSGMPRYVQAAHALAATAVANNLPALIGTCDPASAAGACLMTFLADFAPRAYRRPLAYSEQQALMSAYMAGAASTSTSPGGFAAGLQSMLETVLTSHPFLFREELGTGGAAGPLPQGTVVRLTAYEIASELSFLITGSLPDDALFAAAASGRLQTVDDYLREFQRLLATPAAKPALRAFATQWLGTDPLGAPIAKDTSFYPNWTPSLDASMAAELDLYFDQVFFDGSGSLRELFTSPQAFVDPLLAPIYGALPPMGSGFQPLSLDPTIRGGVLTRAGWLTAHSDFDNSGPVTRGLAVRTNLLCDPIPPPPVLFQKPPTATTAAQMLTTRQVLEMLHTASSTCNGCHNLIDDIGFGFEEFDALGQYRTTENTQPIDDSGQFVGTDIDGPFKGAAQLEQKLLTSQKFLACFATQVYRDAMGQLESPDAASTIADIQRCFSVDTSVTAAFAALIREPAFVLRKAQ